MQGQRIGVVNAGHAGDVQRLFRIVFQRWHTTARIVGVVEESDGSAASERSSRHLISLADGARYRLFQDLGPGSTSCQLDPDSVVSAGEAVLRDVTSGCDLLILSRFGKLEADKQSGLAPPLIAAAEAGIPILTYVPAKFDPAWRRFAEDNFVSLSPDQAALEAWWSRVRV